MLSAHQPTSPPAHQPTSPPAHQPTRRGRLMLQSLRICRDPALIVIWIARSRLAILLAHYTLLLDIPLAILDGVALVVILLAFCQCNLALDQVAFPIQFGGYAGVSFLLYRAEQFGQFAAIQQQLAGSFWIGHHMRTGTVQWYDAAT